jgi:hypothetical protein
MSSHQDHPHHIRSKSDEDKKQMDQSMFLTKNAHIKRPRNAWIHVSLLSMVPSFNSHFSPIVVPLSLWPSVENTRSNPPSRRNLKVSVHLSISAVYSSLLPIRRASRRWSLLSENEKRPWHQRAEEEKQAHKEAFPEYRYCPKRATTITTSPPPSVHPTSTPSFSQQGSYRLPSTNDLDPMVKKSKKV